MLIKLHGVFVPLTQLRQIPKNTLINALHGTLKLITAAGGHPAADAAAKGKKKKGKVKTQTGKFGGAIFKVTQAHTASPRSRSSRRVQGRAVVRQCKGKAGDASAAAEQDPPAAASPAPRASSAPRASTPPRPSEAPCGRSPTAATARMTHAIKDSVTVTDFVRHKTIVLHAGQSYLAKKP